MPNKLEAVFDNRGGATQQEMLVEDSHTGRVQVSVYNAVGGGLGGAQVNIQKQLVLSDGTVSAIGTIETYDEEVDLAIAVGKGNNLYVELTGMTATTNMICKVTNLD